MNKTAILKALWFSAFMLIVLSACQSTAPGGGEETVIGGNAASNVDPLAAESTSTPVPTDTPELLPTSTPIPTKESTLAPTAALSATATATETSTASPEPGIVRTYEINPDKSEIRFYIDEVLLGNPKTVIGRTNQLTGEILLDMQTPQEAEIGPIQVNARALATDDSFRNRALRRQILDSAQDDYQFITYTALETNGIDADQIVLGEVYNFSLTGELQIRDVVQMVTFEMMVTAVSETELSGFGKATVLRSDFDLQIPSVPNVANVAEDVHLEIDFVAQAAGG